MIRHRLCGAIASLLLIGLTPQTVAARTRIWMTTADGSQRLAPVTSPVDVSVTLPMAEVTIDTARRYQTMRGFGAAVSDASAWLIDNRLSRQQRSRLLRELFGHGRGDLGLDAVRIPIGASDFSLSHYSLAETPGQPQADLAPLRADMLPVLRSIRAINPRLTLIASPWSAPAWMKDSGSLIQGRLKPASHAAFATYLTSFVREMARARVPVDYLTVQNEPHFEPKDYPGMRIEPAQRAAFVSGHLGPMLRREAPRTRLLEWDHNWDQPESPIAVLSDPQANPYIAGVAWHCYGGNVAAQSDVRNRFPEKEVWFTECASGSWSPDWAKSFAWATRTLIIGTTLNWASGALMWNVALDQDHGPHKGGCGDCRGLVTIDTRTGTVVREPEYYAFAHASRFVRRGSVRIASESRDQGIESVAFLATNRRDITLIVRNDASEARRLRIVEGRSANLVDLPSGAVATITWGASSRRR